MNFCVLGAGAWGTAMAVYLARVVMWSPSAHGEWNMPCNFPRKEKNRDYLPGIEFPSDLQIGREVGPGLMEADFVFFACPSHALRDIAETAAQHLSVSLQLKGPLPCAKDWSPKLTIMPMR